MLKTKAPEDLAKALLTQQATQVAEIPQTLSWLNTLSGQKLSLSKDLRGKFVVVDFWTSCCINCIHMLAELERLERLFSSIPEVAFIGCHSGKFANELDEKMLRQAILRYDIKHAVLNDNEFAFWES